MKPVEKLHLTYYKIINLRLVNLHPQQFIPMQPTNDTKTSKLQRRYTELQSSALEITSKKIQNYVYHFRDVLGQGSFSKVYKGINELTNQQIAIKIIELSSITSAKLEELLNSEIDILKSIQHQNVVQCIEVLSSQRNCYIVTELCDGGDLGSTLSQKGSYSESEICRLAWDIFQGLKYLNSKKIVHRDLKVSNIFMKNGEAKIADFGFAKVSKQTATLFSFTFIDASIGSPIYMSPEGLIYNTYGPKTDIWAYGILLYELTHGHTPAANCATEQQLKRLIKHQMTVNELNSDLSQDLREMIIRCLDINEKTRITIPQIEKTKWMSKVKQQLGIPSSSEDNFEDYSCSSQIQQSFSQTQPESGFRKISVKPLNATSSNFYTATPPNIQSNSQTPKTFKDIKIYRPSENLMKLILGSFQSGKVINQENGGLESNVFTDPKHTQKQQKSRNQSFTEYKESPCLNLKPKKLERPVSSFQKSTDTTPTNQNLKLQISSLLANRLSQQLQQTSDLKESTPKNSQKYNNQKQNDTETNKIQQIKPKPLTKLFPSNKTASEPYQFTTINIKQYQDKKSSSQPIQKYSDLKSTDTGTKSAFQSENIYDHASKTMEKRIQCSDRSADKQNSLSPEANCGILLPGSIYFPECIGILHYCRLLFKYITFLKEISLSSQLLNLGMNTMKDYSQFLLSVLTELSAKVETKKVIYSRMKNTKEIKMKNVIDEYLQKYSAQLSVKLESTKNSKSQQKIILMKLVRDQLQRNSEHLYQKIMFSSEKVVSSVILLAEYETILIFNTDHLVDLQTRKLTTVHNQDSSEIFEDYNPGFKHFQKNTRIQNILDEKQPEKCISKYLQLRQELSGNQHLQEKEDKENRFCQANISQADLNFKKSSFISRRQFLDSQSPPIYKEIANNRKSTGYSLKNTSKPTLGSPLNFDISANTSFFAQNDRILSSKDQNSPNQVLKHSRNRYEPKNELSAADRNQITQSAKSSMRNNDSMSNESAIYQIR